MVLRNWQNIVVDMKTGAVSAAAGSAYAEYGQTKVIVSVYVSIPIPSPPYCFYRI